MKIVFYTAGGTIDKVYFDANSSYEVGDSTIGEVLAEGRVGFDFEINTIFKKDSLDLCDADRQVIYDAIRKERHDRIILTHGTDTMVTTARYLMPIKNKVVVLTGALAPARFRNSDAFFNISFAAAAVQTLANGIHIAMNGQIFNPDKVVKNRQKKIFERC